MSKKDELDLWREQRLTKEYKFGYEKVDALLAKTKERALLLMSAEILALSFLASDLKILELDDISLRIFALVGCFGVLTSVFMSIFVASTIQKWPTPIGGVESEKIKNASNKVDIEKIINKDYANATSVAYDIVERRIRVFGISLIIFVVCVTILFTINIFKNGG